jgi:hypothetical protein
MALKTFNINDKAYKQFSDYCKKMGISMSKRVDNFIIKEVEKIKQHQSNHVHNEPSSSSSSSSTENKHETPSEHHSFAKYC